MSLDTKALGGGQTRASQKDEYIQWYNVQLQE